MRHDYFFQQRFRQQAQPADMAGNRSIDSDKAVVWRRSVFAPADQAMVAFVAVTPIPGWIEPLHHAWWRTCIVAGGCAGGVGGFCGGSSSGIWPGNSRGGTGVSGSCRGGGMSGPGWGLPGGSSRGGSVGRPGSAGGTSVGSSPIRPSSIRTRAGHPLRSKRYNGFGAVMFRKAAVRDDDETPSAADISAGRCARAAASRQSLERRPVKWNQRRRSN